IGVSTHDVAQATVAAAAGADYIGVGPVFATSSKGDALAGRGIELVRTVRGVVGCPIVAIGGIRPQTPAHVRRARPGSAALFAAPGRASAVASAVRAVFARL